MCLFLLAVGLLTVLAAVCDLRSRRIPNWLTIPSLLSGLLFHAVFQGGAGLLDAGLGFALGFGSLLILWLIGSGGGGDAKLMGAVSAWLGFQQTVLVMLLSVAFVALGMLATLFVSALRRGLSATRRRYSRSPQPPRAEARDAAEQGAQRSRRRVIPFAPPLAVATWLAMIMNVLQTLAHQAPK
jgi:prepilin peptidase CpaA